MKNFQHLEKMPTPIECFRRLNAGETPGDVLKSFPPFKGLSLRIGGTNVVPNKPPHAAIVAAHDRKAVESATRHVGAVRWSVRHAG